MRQGRAAASRVGAENPRFSYSGPQRELRIYQADESPCLPSERHRSGSRGAGAAHIVARDRGRRAPGVSCQGLGRILSWRRQHFVARAGARTVCLDLRDPGEPVACASAPFRIRRRSARGNRQACRDRRRVRTTAAILGSDGHRDLWRGGRARLCRIRKPRLSAAACGDVALACCFAQRPDGAVSRRAGSHRRGLSRDRAIRYCAWRPPTPPRLGADIQPLADIVSSPGATRGL